MMTNPTPDQITAATAGLSDPKARDRAVRWLHRWQKAAPELFVEPPRKADIPWDAIDDKWVCAAMDRRGVWFAYDGEAKINVGDWCWRSDGQYWAMSFLKFDPGNMPWRRSIVYRPGHEPGGGA